MPSPLAERLRPPLVAGGGRRIKACAAMAMGRWIVSAMLGIDGLDVTDGENFRRAGCARLFAGPILTVMDNVPMRIRLLPAARQWFEDRCL